MDDSAEKSVGTDQKPSQTTVESLGSNLSEQHVTPEPRVHGTLVVRGLEDKFQYTTEYHWTVRKRVTEMTNRTASILLKVWLVDCLLNGVSLTDYLGVEYLTNYILGQKTDPLEIRDEKDRQSVLLGLLLLAGFRGEWFTLGEVVKLPPKIVQEIGDTGWLPTKRVFMSWKQYHEPWRFLEVLAVPLDTYDVRDQSSVRYSSYTKHYGNGGHISRTKKTPYDSELDGEATDRDPPDFNLLEIEQYNHILLSLEREKLARRFERK
jgi:hypothetical protein